MKLTNEDKAYLRELGHPETDFAQIEEAIGKTVYTLNFKSKYSIRLYEYLKSIHYKKLKPYSQSMAIDKFQKMLDSNYEDFKDFHTRVLKPAQKEINTYSDIHFEYELIKEGRKVVAITISIETKEVIERMRITTENERLLEERFGKSE